VQWAFQAGVQLLRAGRASLLLRRSDDQTLAVVASVGIDASVLSEIRVEMGRGIAGIVADRGVGLFGSKGNTTFMSVPIVTAHGVIGVFNVTDRVDGEQYTDDDISLARSVADHVATLLEYGSYEAHDPVTHLLTRASFEEALARELARSKRTGSSCTVAVVSLQGVQDVAALCGAGERDERLRQLADTCRGRVRRYDVVGRLSEDEFALLLPDTAAASSSIRERFEESAREIFQTIDIAVRIRVGLARCPTDGNTSHELLERARARMQGIDPMVP
jgi:diguanylate cyclase (GGDEF)-like protein